MDDPTYQQERKFSLDAEYSDVEHYDKCLLTLSAGGFKSDVGPAFQLRRYAWTAKLPLSILTNFEEFAVYKRRA